MEKVTVPLPRTMLEVQRAHDILGGILTNDDLRERILPKGFVRDGIRYLEALCWVLGHDGDSTFAGNLEWIERQANKLGITLEQHDEYFYGGRPPEERQ